MATPQVGTGRDPLWFKDAIIYELHVRAFVDSDEDGIGDFPGLTSKLDYLQELGVTALWLLPFYPSPLKDDGYDIADYAGIHPSYGTMADFRRFLREAHRRGLRVITELVINHTSDQHPWFQRARRAKPGSAARNYYVWNDTPEKYEETRIIFKDFEHSNWAWDPVAHAYYWHRFYSHQPDLNYDNPQVRAAVKRVMDYWFRMGVDGMRLDAIPYLVERENTNCENLPETHEVLKDLRAHLDGGFPDRMFLAEANQWPEDAAAYFGDGDECHMNFHFPLMPRLFMALRMEDRFPVIDILSQTPEIPGNCQWAIFLRNHDELTLEMVTDEERDYMYKVYAHDPQARINLGIRRRLAPLLDNNRRKIELMNSLLLSLPGTPVLYYGDEIGMGDNIYLGDRNGVRTPMQWSGDRNAGFSRANPQRLYFPVITDPAYHYEAINVEAQQDNPSSLLWWMRRLIALRKQYRAFGRGSLEFLYPENRKILAYTRRYEDECILVVVNLSRFTQPVRLDLSAFRGSLPVELFGRTEFPPIGDEPYFLTLGAHTFQWFGLESPGRRREAITVIPARKVAAVRAGEGWEELLAGELQERMERALPDFLRTQRWFRGKARRIRSVRVADSIELSFDGAEARIALVQVTYNEGDAETYLLPLALASGDRARDLLTRNEKAVVARLELPEGGGEGVIYDAVTEPAFARALLDLIVARRRARGSEGDLVASTFPVLRELAPGGVRELEPSALRAEQSNSSVTYGDALILKLFRRVDEGVSTDFEIGRFLTERGFPHSPAVAAVLDYRTDEREPRTAGLLHQYVPNEGDAWQLTLDELGRFFERAAAAPPPPREHGRVTTDRLLELAEARGWEAVGDMIGPYVETALLLGRRTAELHTVLSSETDHPAFAPEAFSTLYQRSVYQSMRNGAGQALQALAASVETLSEGAREAGRQVLELEDEILARLRAMVDTKITATRIRNHGDFHLGQVLYTGKDFFITDFEGEPARPLSERRIKRSPLRDVAGMIRSFHYAAYTALDTRRAEGWVGSREAAEVMELWARVWYGAVSAAFLNGYSEEAAGKGYLPATTRERGLLLDAFLLEKALYELTYELNNRPDWLSIPVRGILQLMRP